MILSDVTKGQVPDFGFLNELKFDDEQRIGWNLFIDLVKPYPKYQKLDDYINDVHKEKRLMEE